METGLLPHPAEFLTGAYGHLRGAMPNVVGDRRLHSAVLERPLTLTLSPGSGERGDGWFELIANLPSPH
jgi:hypothetical protein